VTEARAKDALIAEQAPTIAEHGFVEFLRTYERPIEDDGPLEPPPTDKPVGALAGAQRRSMATRIRPANADRGN